MSIPLEAGTIHKRSDIHDLLGGRRQHRISPSNEAPAVLLFMDPAADQRHGFHDGFDEHGFLQYTGEGQTGDQRMAQGNKAIQNHEAGGRSLEVFSAARNDFTYLGTFKLHDTLTTDRPDRNGDMRTVFIFRLAPITPTPERASVPHALIAPRDEATVQPVPVEAQHTERSFANPTGEPSELERREASLITRYAAHLRAQGHVVSRLRVVPKGEVAPLYSDLLVEDTRELIEAKGASTREAIRMAIGQLLDYGRFAEDHKRSVLLPAEPREDLLALLAAHKITAIYPVENEWRRTDETSEQASR